MKEDCITYQHKGNQIKSDQRKQRLYKILFICLLLSIWLTKVKTE